MSRLPRGQRDDRQHQVTEHDERHGASTHASRTGLGSTADRPQHHERAAVRDDGGNGPDEAVPPPQARSGQDQPDHHDDEGQGQCSQCAAAYRRGLHPGRGIRRSVRNRPRRQAPAGQDPQAQQNRPDRGIDIGPNRLVGQEKGQHDHRGAERAHADESPALQPHGFGVIENLQADDRDRRGQHEPTVQARRNQGDQQDRDDHFCRGPAHYPTRPELERGAGKIAPFPVAQVGRDVRCRVEGERRHDEQQVHNDREEYGYRCQLSNIEHGDAGSPRRVAEIGDRERILEPMDGNNVAPPQAPS